MRKTFLLGVLAAAGMGGACAGTDRTARSASEARAAPRAGGEGTEEILAHWPEASRRSARGVIRRMKTKLGGQ